MPPKAFIRYIEEAHKRRKEQLLRDIYTVSFLQAIARKPREEVLPYVEALKEIYPDKKPKPKEKTSIEIIEYLRQKLVKAENFRRGVK